MLVITLEAKVGMVEVMHKAKGEVIGMVCNPEIIKKDEVVLLEMKVILLVMVTLLGLVVLIMARMSLI